MKTTEAQLHSDATPSSSSSPSIVEIFDDPIIRVITFGISLPQSMVETKIDSNSNHNRPSVFGTNGIVGSIVIMGGKSAMIWVGWGALDSPSSESSGSSSSGNATEKKSFSFGKGSPVMGQLVVAMPRTNYKGAFSTGSKEVSCSQLIGSASSEDQMLANQMASRLSFKSGISVFVSSSLSDPPPGTGNDINTTGNSIVTGGWNSGGLDSELFSHRAAALAENKIWRILQQNTETNTLRT